MPNKNRIISYYLCFDILAAVVTWILFFSFRKWYVSNDSWTTLFYAVSDDPKFYLGLLFYPIYWIILHAFLGCYTKVFRKSRLKELEKTLFETFIGTLIFFFSFILDDIVTNPYDYLLYFIFLFIIQFITTYIPRLSITTNTINKIRSGQIGFNTLIIGADQIAHNAYHAIIHNNPTTGNYILGYILTDSDESDQLASLLPCMGRLNQIEEVVKKYHITELIIAIPKDNRKYIEEIITQLMDYDINLKIMPDVQDYWMGTVKVSSILHEPFITISPEYLDDWQKYVKRFLDIFCSLIAILLLTPVYLFLAIGVKLSSRGPIFYLQERVGYKGIPFKIIKFRSMVEDAEQGTPRLSSDSDPRITKFGKFMRKSRLDETPQFFNVLMGDMSLVGPRPERQYYIDQIVKVAPQYKLLLRVRPGITSWGQVKFGYAENVEQMVQRLKWDILYIENMSIQMDIKILIYTVLIILKRSGK